MYAIVLIFGQSEQVWVRETKQGARELYNQKMQEYDMFPANMHDDSPDDFPEFNNPWNFCNTHCWSEMDDKTMFLTKVAA